MPEEKEENMSCQSPFCLRRNCIFLFGCVVYIYKQMHENITGLIIWILDRLGVDFESGFLDI